MIMGLRWAEEHEYSERTRFIAWIVVISICYVDGILLLIGFRNFRRLENLRLMIIQKRYPQIVRLESTFGWLLSFILVPFLYTTYIQLEMFSDYQRYIDRFTFCVYPFAHFIVGCETMRLWLICYDLNYLHHQKNMEWQANIDESICAESHWWTAVSNRKTFGNYQWLRYRIVLWCLFAGLTPSLIYQYFGWTPITQIFDAFFYAAPILFELGTFYLCPKIVDTFMFMFEFKTTSFIFVTGLGGYLVGMVLMFFDLFIAQTIMALSGQWGLSVVSLLSTLYIPHQIAHSDVWHRELHRQPPMSRSRSHSHSSTYSTTSSTKRARKGSSVRSRSPSPSPQAGDDHRNGRKSKHSKRRKRESNYVHRLKEAMLKEEEFGRFVHWMYKEFSSESILSFIEFVQFKRRAIDVLKNLPEYSVEQKDLHCPYRFYPKIPRSTIVYSEMDSVSSNGNEHYPDPEISQIDLSPMSITAQTSQPHTDPSPRPSNPSLFFRMSSLHHLSSLQGMGHHQPQSTPSPLKLASASQSSSHHAAAGLHDGVPTPIEGSVGTATNDDVLHPVQTESELDPAVNLEIEFSEMIDPRVQALRTSARKLHEKYIAICSEFEINISAGYRRMFYEYDSKQWDLDCLGLVHLFDDVTECMFAYMKQSYLRFEKADQLR